MATAEPAVAARERLVDALRPALDDAGEAPRLACLLAGRARFAARLGRPPGGDLAVLPAPFDDVRVPTAARDALRVVEDGPIGAGYEAALDADDRDARGQYFTPEPIAAALVDWAVGAVSEGIPTVLDPAVGTGTFLRAAAERLAPRAADPSSLLRGLHGVDVDGVALQLAGLRLAAAAGVAAPDGLSLHHRSFFDGDPDGPSGPPRVDAVVGNPPFVRAEAVSPRLDHYRAHLETFDGPTDWADGEGAIGRRSDAYAYFVTQATRFLRPGGRLALVLPTKWLMSAYGEDLRRFLRAQYRVHAVVGFDGRAFDDALVDTALLLAERDTDAPAGAPLRFVSLPGRVGPEELAAAVGAEPDVPAVRRRQGALTASGSLARYLEAPAELLELLAGPAFVRLDELAAVSRGTMTGANRFFFVDAADVERFGLEDRFLRPAVKSLRSVDRPAVEESDVERWLIDAHPLVGGLDGDTAAAKVALASSGAEGLLGYVEHAEDQGWHEGRTCRSRRIWFDLGELRAPAAFVPKLLRERVFAIANDARAVPSNAIDGVWPADGVCRGALLAALNSSVGTAAMEVTGRDEAGLLQLMTYETASLPALDVRSLEPTAAERLAAAGRAYATAPGEPTQQRLDEAVDAAFDLPIGPAALREQARELRRRRTDAGG